MATTHGCLRAKLLATVEACSLYEASKVAVQLGTNATRLSVQNVDDLPDPHLPLFARMSRAPLRH